LEFRKLPLMCQCGGLAKHPSAVGLSANNHLVVEWRCPRCGHRIYMDCPEEASNDHAAAIMDETADRRFLHSVGVRYPDEQ
jgi:hypothetical protein